MTRQTATLTNFLQHPGDIFPGLKKGGMVLRRRDGEDLFVLERRQWEAATCVWRALAAHYLDIQADRAPQTAKRTAQSTLPWLSLLEEKDRQECLQELVLEMQAALESGEFSRLVDTLADWRATALATWDDRRNRERSSYQEYDPVPFEQP